jgi:hypothetical protein
VSPTNIIRSLAYIEEKANLILLDARGGARAAAIHEVVDIKEFWRFYKELVPYLESYATQVKNEQINHHTRLYVQHRDTMDAYQKRRTWFWYIFSSSDRYRDNLITEEYIQLLQDICNNVSNFIYQVKINSEAV